VNTRTGSEDHLSYIVSDGRLTEVRFAFDRSWDVDLTSMTNNIVVDNWSHVALTAVWDNSEKTLDFMLYHNKVAVGIA
jgi:hypothetical protein